MFILDGLSMYSLIETEGTVFSKNITDLRRGQADHGISLSASGRSMCTQNFFFKRAKMNPSFDMQYKFFHKLSLLLCFYVPSYCHITSSHNKVKFMPKNVIRLCKVWGGGGGG